MAENHIITVTYTGCRTYTTRHLFQYDYGQELHLDGFPIPATFEMHFSVGQGKTVTMIGTDGVIAVPDQCLQRAGTAAAWLFLHDTEDDGETKCVFVMPVDPRGAITYQEPTPVQQDTITQAIAALNTAVEQTGADVVDTNAAKVAAEAAQAAAEAAADDADRSKRAAAGSAVDAEASRGAADVSATNAGISERAAAASALAAQTAQGKAETAQGKAETAQEKAEIAQGKAEDAQAAAEAAAASLTNLIDDTAGAGDVTKVWSADKTHTEVSQLNGAINELPTEETGEALLEEEAERTVLEEYFLDALDRIFTNLPQDDAAGDILAELTQENLWLDMLQRELEARESA